jgi:hypothetical protein
MSQLTLATRQATWSLNATQINSPIYGQISSAQTKNMAMHFPIRCTQPEIQFDVVFPSENEYEQFQRFVRAHQQDALANLQLLTLNWPQRNINNWTGVIKSFQAGGKRFNFAPTASFSVDLVDSMVSQRIGLINDVLNVESIYGVGSRDGVLTQPSVNQPGIGSAAGSNGTLVGSSTSSPQINSSIPGLNTGVG